MVNWLVQTSENKKVDNASLAPSVDNTRIVGNGEKMFEDAEGHLKRREKFSEENLDDSSGRCDRWPTKTVARFLQSRCFGTGFLFGSNL